MLLFLMPAAFCGVCIFRVRGPRSQCDWRPLHTHLYFGHGCVRSQIHLAVSQLPTTCPELHSEFTKVCVCMYSFALDFFSPPA